MATALPLAACAGEFSTLDPAGPAAARVAELWWVMFAGAVVILAGVTAVALYSLRRDRRGHAVSSRKMLIGWGLVFPLVTLAALMGYAFIRGEQLLAKPDPAVLTVHAHAQQWRWLFGYPDGEQTLNALHVPAGAPFRVRVTSADVIHSFWAPRLGGKIDAVPGRENAVVLQADQPGLYRGTCNEFCGVGHAHMTFVIHAHPPEDYAAALAEAADLRPGLDLPVREERRTPALEAIREGFDYLLRWLRIR